MEEDVRIYKENGNTIRQETMYKEIKNNRIAFEVREEG